VVVASNISSIDVAVVVFSFKSIMLS